MIEFCITADELRKALSEIERAEKNGFLFCLSVFTFSHAGRSLEDNRAVYSDLVENASMTDGRLQWGRFQGITRKYRFVNGKLELIESTTNTETGDTVQKRLPLADERDRIRGMVLAGNHGWAILALLELLDVQPVLALDAVEESLRIGRLRKEVQAIMREGVRT